MDRFTGQRGLYLWRRLLNLPCILAYAVPLQMLAARVAESAVRESLCAAIIARRARAPLLTGVMSTPD